MIAMLKRLCSRPADDVAPALEDRVARELSAEEPTVPVSVPGVQWGDLLDACDFAGAMAKLKAAGYSRHAVHKGVNTLMRNGLRFLRAALMDAMNAEFPPATIPEEKKTGEK